MSLSWPVHWHDEIDSTNSEAKRVAEAGRFTPCWIAARRQTAGRGRLGRDWASPDGNLFTTALFYEPGGFVAATRIPFAAALAVSDIALTFAPSTDVRLKWPNDVRIQEAKLSGILIEAGQSEDTVWVAAGIGINVTHVPGAAGQAATSLADLSGHAALTADSVLAALRETFAARLEEARRDFAQTRTAWLSRAEGLGQTVRVSPGDEPIEGVFETLADDGGLILRLPNGAQQTIRAGDVELIKQVGR